MITFRYRGQAKCLLAHSATGTYRDRMTESPRPPWEPGPGGPGGGYPPAGGYPSGPGVPPPGYPTPDDRAWALSAHFGGAAGVLLGGVLGWVVPLIALLVQGPQSPTVRAHAVATLNFHLLWAAVDLGALVLAGCLDVLVVPRLLYLVPLVPIILGITGGIRAIDGQLYRYPVTVTWIR